MNNNQIVNYLGETRIKNCISQEKMASKLGVSLRTYQRFENFEAYLTVTQFLRAIEVLSPELSQYIYKALYASSISPDDHIPLRDDPEFNDLVIRSAVLSENNKEYKYLKAKMERHSIGNIHKLGYWDFTPSIKETHYSDDLLDIFDANGPEEMTYEAVIPKVIEEDRERFLLSFQKFFEHDWPYNEIFTLVGKDSSLKKVHIMVDKTKHNNNDLCFALVALYKN